MDSMTRVASRRRRNVAGTALTWNGAANVVLAMAAVIAVRLHEFVPGVSAVQPALLTTILGVGYMLHRVPVSARMAAIRHPLLRLSLAYWLFMIVTVPFALWPGLAFSGVRAFVPVVALLFVMLCCPRDIRSLTRIQAGIAILIVLYAVYVLTLGRISDMGRLSAGVGMYDSNDMAALLALGVPLALGLARTERGRTRVLMLGAAILMVAVILASGSRGGLIGLGAGMLILVLGVRGTARFAAIGGAAVVVIGLWSFSPAFRDRVASISHLEGDYNLTDEVGRKAVWARGRQYIRDHPVTGVGAGNFPVAEGNHWAVTYGGLRGGKWSSAHNAYIQAYAELGVIGGTLFIAILLFGVIRGWRLWRGLHVATGLRAHRPELLASLVAAMVCGIFLSHAYFPPLFAVLGLIALADRTQPRATPTGRVVRRGHPLTLYAVREGRPLA